MLLPDRKVKTKQNCEVLLLNKGESELELRGSFVKKAVSPWQHILVSRYTNAIYLYNAQGSFQ